ncbi:hypothetical protein J6590_063628 [Homalodisca vitripennis]|nr:hypothetical protein J6590_063628 [Homalodisca vitripennis]
MGKVKFGSEISFFSDFTLNVFLYLNIHISTSYQDVDRQHRGRYFVEATDSRDKILPYTGIRDQLLPTHRRRLASPHRPGRYTNNIDPLLYGESPLALPPWCSRPCPVTS